MADENSITDFCNPTNVPKKLRFSNFFEKVKGGLYAAKEPLRENELIYCAKHLMALKFSRGKILHSTEAAKNFFVTKLANYDKEVFVALFLGVGHKILGYEEIREGSLTYAGICMRDLVRTVLAKNAAAIIIAHNHLSNNVTPSPDDLTLTLKVRDVLREIETTLLDHIIVSGGKALSFVEKRLILTAKKFTGV